MKLFILTIIIFSFNAFAFYPGAVGPMKVGKSDSGIEGPSYNEIVRQMKNLAKIYPDFAEVHNLGITVDGSYQYGIIIRNKNVTPKKMIYISGSTHGDEYLNIADRLIVAFLDKENEEFFSYYENGGVFMVIPVFNPYGYKNRIRQNRALQDLNRDYSNVVTGVDRFIQKETQNTISWVEGFLADTGAKFVLSMDYHCCFGGALLQPWAFQDVPIAPIDREKHDELGELMVKQFPGATYGPTTDIIWYAPDGTSKDYYYGKHGAIAGTFEGRYRAEKENLPKHIAWFKDIVETFGK